MLSIEDVTQDIISKSSTFVSQFYVISAYTDPNALKRTELSVQRCPNILLLALLCLFRLREGVMKMKKHLPEHKDEHVEFLPVEWRSKLSLDGG